MSFATTPMIGVGPPSYPFTLAPPDMGGPRRGGGTGGGSGPGSGGGGGGGENRDNEPDGVLLPIVLILAVFATCGLLLAFLVWNARIDVQKEAKLEEERRTHSQKAFDTMFLPVIGPADIRKEFSCDVSAAEIVLEKPYRRGKRTVQIVLLCGVSIQGRALPNLKTVKERVIGDIPSGESVTVRLKLLANGSPTLEFPFEVRSVEVLKVRSKQEK